MQVYLGSGSKTSWQRKSNAVVKLGGNSTDLGISSGLGSVTVVAGFLSLRLVSTFIMGTVFLSDRLKKYM